MIHLVINVTHPFTHCAHDRFFFFLLAISPYATHRENMSCVHFYMSFFFFFCCCLTGMLLWMISQKEEKYWIWLEKWVRACFSSSDQFSTIYHPIQKWYNGGGSVNRENSYCLWRIYFSIFMKILFFNSWN